MKQKKIWIQKTTKKKCKIGDSRTKNKKVKKEKKKEPSLHPFQYSR